MSFICFKTVDCHVCPLVQKIRHVDRATHLARFSSTEQQHLDLILREHAVALQLVLDLIIACIHNAKTAVASMHSVRGMKEEQYARALASSSMILDCAQPIFSSLTTKTWRVEA